MFVVFLFACCSLFLLLLFGGVFGLVGVGFFCLLWLCCLGFVVLFLWFGVGVFGFGFCCGFVVVF